MIYLFWSNLSIMDGRNHPRFPWFMNIICFIPFRKISNKNIIDLSVSINYRFNFTTLSIFPLKCWLRKPGLWIFVNKQPEFYCFGPHCFPYSSPANSLKMKLNMQEHCRFHLSWQLSAIISVWLYKCCLTKNREKTLNIIRDSQSRDFSVLLW